MNEKLFWALFGRWNFIPPSNLVFYLALCEATADRVIGHVTKTSPRFSNLTHAPI